MAIVDCSQKENSINLAQISLNEKGRQQTKKLFVGFFCRYSLKMLVENDRRLDSFAKNMILHADCPAFRHNFWRAEKLRDAELYQNRS